MKTSKLLLSVGLGLAMMTGGCRDTYEDNEDWCLDETYRVPLNILVNVDRSFSDYLTVDSTAMDNEQYCSTRGDPSWMTQYYVAVYDKEKKEPIDVVSSFDNPVRVKVRPGKYSFVGWASLTPPIEDTKSPTFNMDDFNEIMLKQKYDYVANDPYKIPYRGRVEHSVAYTSDEIELTATPAMAKFRLIATDTPQFSPCRAVVSYSSLPAAVNGLTGKINYAWSDIQFEHLIADDNLIAADCVFSEETETEVNVKIEIYDTRNAMVARLSNLKIPLKNGGITTVKGNFYSILDLKGISSGGISIDTEFEGTYEIEI